MMVFELLNVRTMLMFGAVSSLILAGVMTYFSIARRTYPGFHYWTGGVVSAGLGGVVISLRGIVPDFISIILGNFLLLLLPLMFTKGLIAFVDVPNRVRVVNSVVLFFFTLVLLWATYIEPSLRVRIVCFCLIMAFFFFEALVIAIKYIPPVLGEQDWLIVASIIFSIFGLLFRVVVVSLHDHVSLFNNTEIFQGIAISMSILAAIASGYSFLILNTHRMENDLSAANKRIEALANVDGVTSIFNRRYFDTKLELEIKRLQRSSLPISLVMADVDCFKQYNDTYGHQAGDDCLREVAAVFKKSCRRVSDIAARYGGEEFIMLLPNTDLHGAETVAGGIQKAIDSLAIPHKASTVSDAITLSIGVASVNSSRSVSSGELVSYVDQALYRSKKNGKNQIQIYEEQS
ncbi:GGDEF domain-containing protein [Oceanidesulfovibrio marinus]|uniref:diguanylate cyclase n=1 Tax=Oceanidesulfovibrio marinus TaxID=370038 RepID=A0ABX6NC35_9BACT|nr:diguanylate cyclase [Oceanidesulfovibrio marinus]QJT08158.1 diguanylate cyclase [Oceanidesulfovibrio marinus]